MTLLEAASIFAPCATPIALSQLITENEQALSLTLLTADPTVKEELVALEDAYYAFRRCKGFREIEREDPDELPAPVEALLLLFATAFERSESWGTLTTIQTLLPVSSVKKRLQAKVLLSQVSNARTGYAAAFEPIMALLKEASFEEEQDYSSYTAQVVRDFWLTAHYQLEARSLTVSISHLQFLFTQPENQARFPLLHHPAVTALLAGSIAPANALGLVIQSTATATAQQPLYPSLYISSTFQRTILDAITQDSRSMGSYERPLGYDNDSIRHYILEYGRADFQKECVAVRPPASPADRVLLYCYYNLRKHFFTTRHVLNKIIDSLPNLLNQPNARPVFVDLGCGPLTAGLALGDLYMEKFNKPLSVHYVGIDIAPAMLTKAQDFTQSPVFDSSSTFDFFTNWHAALDTLSAELVQLTNPIFLNASYLFASSSLVEADLALFVAELQRRCPAAPVYFIFQNPNRADRNVKYVAWKQLLPSLTQLASGAAKVFYKNNSRATRPPSFEEVYYELLAL